MRFVWLLFACALSCVAGNPGEAAILYGFDQSSYDLLPGQSIPVPLRLIFTDADASSLLANGGLLSAAVRLVQTTAPPLDPVMASSITANVTDFDDPVLTPILTGPSPASTALWEF